MIEDKNLTIIENREIQNMIYTFRGRQVMIDRNLAYLYNVETKVLNQAVKRNLNRFPEHFRFQLTEEEYENLRSQFVTSSEDNTHGGRRYMPYVFTEQGIAMLSAVLKSDVAVEVSIKIMNNFVEMRNFLLSKEIEKNAIPVGLFSQNYKIIGLPFFNNENRIEEFKKSFILFLDKI